MEGFGHLDAKIMIVDEAPSKDEMLLNRPLTGLAGKHFINLMREAGVEGRMVYFTFAVRTTYSGKYETAFEPFRRKLWEKMKQVQPAVIVSLGANVTKTLLRTSKSKFRLSDVVGKKQRLDYFSADCLPWYRPEWIVRHGKKAANETVATWKEHLAPLVR